MILRILPLILLLGACSPSSSSDTAEATTMKEEQPQEKAIQKAESSAELADMTIKLLSEALTLTPEQQTAIQDAVAAVPLESIQSDDNQRIMVRKKIISEILTAEQMATWQAYRKQQNRAPVVIE